LVLTGTSRLVVPGFRAVRGAGIVTAIPVLDLFTQFSRLYVVPGFRAVRGAGQTRFPASQGSLVRGLC